MKTKHVFLLIILYFVKNGLIFAEQVKAENQTKDISSSTEMSWSSRLFDLMLPPETRKDSRLTSRVFFSLKKAVLILSPTNKEENIHGSTKQKSVTYQPNMMPGPGIGLFFKGIGLVYERTLSPTENSRRERGDSKAAHYELHYIKKSIGIDLYRQAYRGFYQRSLDKHEYRPFQDSIFQRDGVQPQFPSLTMDIIGADVYYAFSADSFPIGPIMNQTNDQISTGWSMLMMGTYFNTKISNPSSLVPADQAIYYENDAKITGEKTQTISLMPGIGFVLSGQGFYLGGLGFCGPSLQHQEFFGISKNRDSVLGSNCNLRGSVGYNSPEYFTGISGYKNLETSTVSGLNITTSISMVQFFIGYRFKM